MSIYREDQINRPRRVIGLVAGTSVSGIDAAAVVIHGRGDDVTAEVAAFVTIPMDMALRGHIQEALSPKRGSTAFLTTLHAALGLAFADAAVNARSAAGWARNDVDAVGCQGQTAWRQCTPVEVAGAFVTGSLQLGDPAGIAEATGAPVVSDFPARDMAAGGQGAPMAAMADWLLHRHPNKKRAVLNIGGVGSVTWLPAGGSIDDVIAFDTGPGNLLLDAAMAICTGGTKTFDETGAWAARGHVKDALLQLLLEHEYFGRRPPKTTGREEFGRQFVEGIRGTLCDPKADWIATLTALVAESIARAIREFLPSRPSEVIVCGGGARNATLMMMIRKRVPCPVLTAEDAGWNGAAADAVTCAVLADRTMQGLPGNVPHATGAAHPVVLGSVTF